ncbi:phosphate ABC transporter substrate-binding protein PstS [Streptomyces sp. NBC_00696]|uniref:phosphate ABC transporter substrate-binding protein PstS n=1 Tax=Streptomyces sp. NBC_00696 TaxID=2903672 RepID=UPI002E31A13D|nr:phosphate ABC transporter substrate-binding protein PstS [Streptomyces sp. NBC_00696]
MQHRRKDRIRQVPVVAAVAAAVVAVGGAAWIFTTADDSRGADGQAAHAPAADPRIKCATRGQVPGSGSTAQQNAMKYWIDQYQRACPRVQIAYNPLGSTAGVAQYLTGAIAFGGSDRAVKPEEQTPYVCHGGHTINLPTVGGPIAVGYSLSGVDDLVLDAPTLAKIFDSRITKWDDPAIRALNPGVELPDLDIHTVHRSDGSGTTQNFTAYLATAAHKQWAYPVSNMWPGKGGNSANGSDSVASEVAGTQGAIGYFELSFATKSRIPTVRIDTGASRPVAPSPATASAGIATAKVVGKGKDLALQLDYATHNSNAYPIVLVTYEVVCDKGNQAATLPALKSFLAYTVSDAGQENLGAIHYAPLPAAIAARVREVIGTLS